MPTEHTPPTAPNAPEALPSRGVLAYVLGGVALGVLLGALGLLVYQEHLPKITKSLYYTSIAVFSGVVMLFVLLLVFKKYLMRHLLGHKAANAEHFLDDAQHLSDKLTVLLVDKLMPEDAVAERERAKSVLPKLAHWFVWARLRNWWWQWLLGVFIAVGGLTGTLLLMNQNDLLTSQNVLLETQNTLVQTQNQLAANQMYLSEASRRSALVFLMSNILDKVDAEIALQKEKNPKDSLFSLTPSLIGQIVALSHSFKPYRYLDGDTLIGRPLSPERGQLLITLTLLPLDSVTRGDIYARATFEDAALQKARLFMANLRGVDLMGADLGGSGLGGADLSWADLTGASLREADLTGANLREANLTGANLREADLSGAKVTLLQLQHVHILYECKNLHDSLRIPLMDTHPHLFEEPKY